MAIDILRKRLEEYFEKDKYTSKKIFEILSLFIYQLEAGETDLYMLAKLIPEENLRKLINYYDGDKIYMPTVEKYKECKLLAFTFYMREIKRKPWSEIKGILNLPENFESEISSISLGKKHPEIKKKLNEEIITVLKQTLKDSIENQNMIKTLEKISEEEFENILKDSEEINKNDKRK